VFLVSKRTNQPSSRPFSSLKSLRQEPSGLDGILASINFRLLLIASRSLVLGVYSLCATDYYQLLLRLYIESGTLI
jgi:hypothetical protein